MIELIIRIIKMTDILEKDVRRRVSVYIRRLPLQRDVPLKVVLSV